MVKLRGLSKYLGVGAIALASLMPTGAKAQSSFLNSVPLIGKAPSQVITSDSLNSPTPFEMLMNPYSQPNIQSYQSGGGVS